jgi:hypothetical protein
VSVRRWFGRRLASRPERLLAAGLAVLGEAGLRGLLGWTLSPLAVVCCPPVVAAVALGRVGGDDRSVRSLLDTAVRGHFLSLPAGAALFLLVDTPIRAALYAAGAGDLLSPAVIVLSPLPGVALGTVVAWAVPATSLGAGTPWSVGTAVSAAIRRPRRLGRDLCAHLLGGILAGACLAAGIGAAIATRSVPVLAAAAGVVGLVWIAVAAALADRHRNRSPATGDDGGPSPVAAGLALGLVVALVGGAGAVRVSEHRPVDASATALPADPGSAYATALSNTERRDHRYRVVVAPQEAEPFIVEHRVDRTDRQYRQLLRGAAVGPSTYADTGTGSPAVRGFDRFALGRRTVGPDDRPVRASPDYVQWAADYDLHDAGGLTPPSPDVEGWRVVVRNETTLVLELTDPRAVLASSQARPPDRVTDVSAARVRAVVDADRGIVETVTYRFEGSVGTNETTSHVDARVRYSFAVGVDVRRPDVLAPQSPESWLWKLFAY